MDSRLRGNDKLEVGLPRPITARRMFLRRGNLVFFSFTTSKIRLPRRRFTPPRNDTLTRYISLCILLH
jgi:hypothetical protein